MPLPSLIVANVELGPTVSEAEYNDWADKDHIPPRLAIPAFQKCTRWKAIDNQKPTWVGVYEVDSYKDTLKPPYTTLSQNLTEKDKKLFGGVEIFERYVYEAHEGNDRLPEPSALYDPTKPAPFAHFVTIDPKPGTEDEIARWYEEEHIPHVAKEFSGWVRTRRYVWKEWSRGGVEGSNNQTPPGKFLAIHEYSHIGVAGSQEELDKFKSEWTLRVLNELCSKVEFRLFALHNEFRKE